MHNEATGFKLFTQNSADAKDLRNNEGFRG